MVAIQSDGTTDLLMKPPRDATRHSVPGYHDVVSVAFAARPDYILNAHSMYEGRVLAVEVPPERAIDIDTATGFAVAECLVARRFAAK